MSLGDFLVILAVAMGVVAATGLALIAFVAWRYRIPLRGVVAMGGALLYLVSPLDVLPEGLLGPFGLADDAGVVGLTVLWVYKIVQARKMLQAAGIDLRRPPRTLRRSSSRTVRDPRLSDPVPPRPEGMSPRPRAAVRSDVQDDVARGVQDPPPEWGTPPSR